jgi:hypothetical protein
MGWKHHHDNMHFRIQIRILFLHQFGDDSGWYSFRMYHVFGNSTTGGSSSSSSQIAYSGNASANDAISFSSDSSVSLFERPSLFNQKGQSKSGAESSEGHVDEDEYDDDY